MRVADYRDQPHGSDGAPEIVQARCTDAAPGELEQKRITVGSVFTFMAGVVIRTTPRLPEDAAADSMVGVPIRFILDIDEAVSHDAIARS